jgi:CRISPR system Cascade subunit CasB
MTTPPTSPRTSRPGPGADSPPSRDDSVPEARRDARRDFVTSLYRLQEAIDAGGHLAHAARRDVARLRRSTAGPQQQMQAYEIVFRHDPPEAEQQAWLLLAGLFAINPQPRPTGGDRRSLGGSLRRLARKQNQVPGSDVAAEASSPLDRRFTQLLSVGVDALPHYLRQCLHLLRTESVPVNYYRLLDDLIVLCGDDPQKRQLVRLRWARDFYRPDPQPRRKNTDTGNPDRGDPGGQNPDPQPEPEPDLT